MTLSAKHQLGQPSPPHSASPPADQLLPLLKKLSEQLQRSEAERAVLTEKVAALERQQQAQGDNLIRRIQTAIAQTDRHADRLGQRLESITAEETRLATQLARIEQTVEETRALQSRALTIVAPGTPPQQGAGSAPSRRRRPVRTALILTLGALGITGVIVWQNSLPALRMPALPAKPGVAATDVTTPQAASIDPVSRFLADEQAVTPAVATIAADPSLPLNLQPVEAQARAGKASAQHDLGAFYAGRPHPDYARAALWFRQAALGGVANARYNLGVLAQQGLGVPRNVAQAVGWYRAAAALGHPEASYNLGIASVEGIGTPYDPVAAVADFRRAAAAGIVAADYNLGLIYETGLLGKPDMAQALSWYGQAARLGNKAAATALARMTQGQHPSPTATSSSSKPPAAASAPAIPPSDAAAGPLQPADRTPQ